LWRDFKVSRGKAENGLLSATVFSREDGIGSDGGGEIAKGVLTSLGLFVCKMNYASTTRFGGECSLKAKRVGNLLSRVCPELL
jgi:hypothetical protein